ncbi:MAG TPA: hypothetical protein VMV69_24825 [Pirellulales bacterium]|nr:hypothetical protein [Pirellulales bacterium]
MPDHVAPNGVPWTCCYSCLRAFNGERVGVSLDSSGKPHVCRHCWLKLPIDKRIALKAIGENLCGIRDVVGDFIQWARHEAEANPADLRNDPANWWKRFTQRGGSEN